MGLPGLASDADRGGFTVNGFMDRIIALERRSRALLKGSDARSDAKQELVDILLEGLDQFGRRWADQFKRPVNYMEPLLTSFSAVYRRVITRTRTSLLKVAVNFKEVF